MEFSVKDIIQNDIINPIEEYLYGHVGMEEVNWKSVEMVARAYSGTVDGFSETLHSMMQPLYWRFIIGDIPYGSHLWVFINEYIERYEDFSSWIDDKDILDIVEKINLHQNGAHHFFIILKLIISLNCRSYIAKWPRQRIENEIEKFEVSGSRQKGELFCIMLAYHMIEQTNLSDAKKNNLETLLEENWGFLLMVYSVMIKRIIGAKLLNFAQIVNNVNVMTSCHKYIYIFHNALMLRQAELFPTVIDKEKLGKHITRMEDILKNTPQETTLDELCNIIFGEEFEALLQQKHFKSYDELAEQVKRLEGTVNDLTNTFNDFVQRMRDAVESSVPINIIEDQLLKLDPLLAWDIFVKLNSLLVGEKIWQKHASLISDKIIEKMNNKFATVGNNNGIVAGGNFNTNINLNNEQLQVLLSRVFQQNMISNNNC